MSNIDLFAALSLSRWYAQHPWSIDGLVYLVLFTGLAQVALGKPFTGRAGAAVCGTVGLALAVGAATFAERYDFSLGQLGPLAWVVLLLLLAVVFYQLSRALGVGRWTAIGVAAVVLTVGLANTGAATLRQGTAEPVMIRSVTSMSDIVEAANDLHQSCHLNWSNPRVAQRLPMEIKRTDEELTSRAAQEVRRIR